MKILYYDVFCGISGDMHLGALVDLGVDFDYLKAELKKLNIDEEFTLVRSSGMKHGITGTKVDVVLHNQEGYEQDHNHYGHGHHHSHEDDHGHQDHQHDHTHDDNNRDHVHTHSHDHNHDHEHSHDHNHGHKHSHDHNHGHKHSYDHNHDHDHNHSHEGQGHHHKGHHHNHGHHHHRNFATISDMINSSDLSERVKSLAIEMFRLVAVAEGKVHGKPMEQVHFHEVGATDSIVDIVGAAICIDALKVDHILASKVQVGGGFVKCAHGRMPVPAPATAEILKDVPLNYNIVPFETTTPTGAAILKANVEEYTENKSFAITRIGYGLGNKDFEIPNVLRVYLGEISEVASDLEIIEQFIAEANIDDMNPELFGFIEQRLFEVGALDVYKTPIIMKKGRHAVKLSVLFNGEDRKKIQDIIFRETSSAGLREYPVKKYMMRREFETVETIYGEVRVKNFLLKGELVKSKPEYEDCQRLARDHQVSIHEIYKAVQNK